MEYECFCCQLLQLQAAAEAPEGGASGRAMDTHRECRDGAEGAALPAANLDAAEGGIEVLA